MAQLKSTNITGNLAVTGNILASKIIKLGGTADQILLANGEVATLSNLGAGTVTSVGITNGGGLSITGSPITGSGTITISHADTSSQASMTTGGRTYVNSITLDTYGHVTAIGTGTETVTDTNTTYSFAGGNNGFTVTPSDGSAQTVGVTATRIYRQDTRSDNPAPYQSEYANLGYLSLHLKSNSTLGITGQNSYSALVEVYPWQDSSGGAAHQLAFGTNGAILHRYGTSTWSAWNQLATQAWVEGKGYMTGYTLPLSANGTRGGIQIGYSETENNRALKLSSEKAYISLPTRLADYSTSGYGDANDATTQGWHYMTTTATNRPPFKQSSNKDYRIMSTAYSSSWVQQIATDFRGNDMFLRRRENGTWKPWTPIVRFQDCTADHKMQTITDNAIARWDSGGTAMLQNSGATIDDSGNITATSFKKSGGTDDDILMGNGSTISKQGLIDSLEAAMEGNSWRPVKYGSTTLNDTSTTLEFLAGSNIGLTFTNGQLTIAGNYSNATTTTDGLMSADDKKNLTYYVKGTQTASTNAWTGNLTQISELYEGLTIRYRLPYAGTSSGATLNLTLSGGTTGAKNIYRYGTTTQITTHFAAGSVITMTYNGTHWIADAFYDSNSYAYVRQYQSGANEAGTTNKYPLLARYNLTNKNGTYDTAYSRFHTKAYVDISDGSLTANGFKYNDATTGTNDYVLLAGGGTKAISEIIASGSAGVDLTGYVTGTGLTANTIMLGNGDSKIKTSSKTIATTVGTDDTTVPTSKAVKDYVTGLGYITGSYLPLAGGTMTGSIKYAGATREIISFAPDDATWRGGLKYSWSSNTTIGLWGKHVNSQFVWHAGTDFATTDVNGTSTRTYDFQVGRDVRTGGSGNLEALLGGKPLATQEWVENLGYVTGSYLPLAGGTMTGAITLPENKMALKFRTHATSYETGLVYGTTGNEALTFAIQNPVTAFQIVYGTKPSAYGSNTWQSVTPLFQTKDGKVIINRKITTTADTTNLKLLDVNGDIGANGIFVNNITCGKILAPTTSGGTTYGVGTNGQVLKSNGTTVYWGTDSSGGGSDQKTSSSDQPSTQLWIVGAQSASTSGVTTYTNSGCYIGTDNCLYSNGKKVATEEWVTESIDDVIDSVRIYSQAQLFKVDGTPTGNWVDGYYNTVGWLVGSNPEENTSTSYTNQTVTNSGATMTLRAPYSKYSPKQRWIIEVNSKGLHQIALSGARFTPYGINSFIMVFNNDTDGRTLTITKGDTTFTVIVNFQTNSFID